MVMKMNDYLIEIELAERQERKFSLNIKATDYCTAVMVGEALADQMPSLTVFSSKQETEVIARWFLCNVSDPTVFEIEELTNHESNN